jgi:apolipoprotein N-acyltransferase
MGLPAFSPLICYEVIFPGHAVNSRERPAWMLNLTNDAWFGASAGPHQHFASARLRAVEEGLPLVRAANTGISGVVDPYGHVMIRMGVDQAGVIDTPLPVALSRTIFSQFGNFPLGILMILMLLGAMYCKHNNNVKSIESG